MNGPVFALAWNSKHKIIASGGHLTVSIFQVNLLSRSMSASQSQLLVLKHTQTREARILTLILCIVAQVDTSDVERMNQARRAAQISGEKPKEAISDLEKQKEEAGSILRRCGPPLRGPEHCHSDAVKAVVATHAGKIVTGGRVYSQEKKLVSLPILI